MNGKQMRENLHKAIREIVQGPMVNSDIRKALLKRGTIITARALNYQLTQMIEAGELRQHPSAVRRLVDKVGETVASTQSPLPLFAFRPLQKSAPRCAPLRPGALVLERLPRSFNAREV